MKTSEVHKAILEEFPGPSNKRLRAALREAAHGGAAEVEAVGRRIGLTASGEASLREVVRVVRAHVGTYADHHDTTVPHGPQRKVRR